MVRVTLLFNCFALKLKISHRFIARDYVKGHIVVDLLVSLGQYYLGIIP